MNHPAGHTPPTTPPRTDDNPKTVAPRTDDQRELEQVLHHGHFIYNTLAQLTFHSNGLIIQNLPNELHRSWIKTLVMMLKKATIPTFWILKIKGGRIKRPDKTPEKIYISFISHHLKQISCTKLQTYLNQTQVKIDEL